jgi:hypothetical protein
MPPLLATLVSPVYTESTVVGMEVSYRSGNGAGMSVGDGVQKRGENSYPHASINGDQGFGFGSSEDMQVEEADTAYEGETDDNTGKDVGDSFVETSFDGDDEPDVGGDTSFDVVEQVDTSITDGISENKSTPKKKYQSKKKEGAFRAPTADEKKMTTELIGRRVRIYWDGDDAYYPAAIVSYNPDINKHKVLYENDATGIEYDEDLVVSGWQIFEGEIQDKPAKSTTGSNKLSYTNMVTEAVYRLDDRIGSSLVAIRKYVFSTFDVKKQQMASFNSLTLKAVNKAVATGELEKVKNSHSFRLSPAARQSRREKELKALGIAFGYKDPTRVQKVNKLFERIICVSFSAILIEQILTGRT